MVPNGVCGRGATFVFGAVSPLQARLRTMSVHFVYKLRETLCAKAGTWIA